MFTNAILLAGLAMQASAATIVVAVGKNGLAFTPNNIQASQGDILEFHFWAKNHSVVAGSWTKPCSPVTTGGFFSGFVPTAAGAANSHVFQVTVNDTNPIVFYCSQNTGSHCKNGMAAVINPSGSNTLENYLSEAKSVTTAVSPPAPFGGVVAQLPSTTTGGTGTGSTTTTGSGYGSTDTGYGGGYGGTSGTSTGSGSGSGSASTTSSSPTSTKTSGAISMGAPFVGLAAAGAAALLFV